MSESPYDAGAAPHEVPPRCYLHPDRETYISCQRCGRPICPDCMRPASVGYQCPSCVREGQAQVRQARTAGGGLVPGKPGTVSLTLIGINVLAYVAMVATGGLGDSPLWSWGVMLGDSAVYQLSDGSIETLRGVDDGAYWRLLTSAFLHAGILHIAFNMYALYLFGPVLERYLGTVRYLIAYLTSAVAASVFVYVLSPPNQPTLGASGAIFALFGMALVIMYKQGQDVRGLLVLVGINVVITFAVPNISWQGHLGGFVTGLLLGAAFAYAPRARRTLVQYAAFGAVWAAIVVVTAWRTLQLG
ncbi:rhomboid family intramembrane serine protease [Mumia sp. zg.B21]|uniref:rhomboid family intramembrane serine protease n=1 Tax=Mumia sp. zg.B21 TaxID=2855447 RepID=UPI001C6F564C|nr:rhomboid family intramembrane serine protease [Mumia sp. zg.B21]MBW9209955.1 rhomboid family intramembrane serine protease [Mumia sp. zg.B21]